MCVSPAPPAATARRRGRGGPPGRRSPAAAAPTDLCRLRWPGWGADRSFVPREDVVGHAPQILGLAACLGQRRGRFAMRLGSQLSGPLEAEKADVGEFAMSLVASMWLSELLV